MLNGDDESVDVIELLFVAAVDVVSAVVSVVSGGCDDRWTHC